jgi:hypothetical protein
MLRLFASPPLPLASLAEVPATFDVFPAEGLFGPKLIVSPATNAKILGFVRAAECPGLGVVELEKCSRIASATIRGEVRALQSVSLVHVTARRVRDSNGIRLCSCPFARRPFRPRETLPFEVGKQHVDRALDDDAEVAARVRVAHQDPAALELFTKLGPCRELHPVSIG